MGKPMRRDDSGCRRLFVRYRSLAMLAIGALGCGGVSPEAKGCADTLQELREKQADEICSPLMVNHFESQVTRWRDECEATATREEQHEINTKLKNAQSCSEDKRRVEMLTVTCNSRLEKVMNAQICLGDECAPHQKELKEIDELCNAPLLNGAFTEKIGAANRLLEERTTQTDRLQALRNLIMTCDSISDMETAKQAMRTLGELLDAVAITRELTEAATEGSEVDRFKKGAKESCSFALLGVLEKITEMSPKEIARIRESGRRLKRYVKRFKRLGDRLKKAQIPALFPNATAPLSDLLKALDVTEEEYSLAMSPIQETPPANVEAAVAPAPEEEPIEEVGPSESPAATEAGATAAGDATAAAGLSRADEKKCKALKKKLKHFTAKRDAYEKKGNTAKTSAYSAKRDQTIEKMNGIGCPAPPE